MIIETIAIFLICLNAFIIANLVADQRELAPRQDRVSEPLTCDDPRHSQD